MKNQTRGSHNYSNNFSLPIRSVILLFVPRDKSFRTLSQFLKDIGVPRDQLCMRAIIQTSKMCRLLHGGTEIGLREVIFKLL